MSHKTYEISLTVQCSLLQTFFYQIKANDIEVCIEDCHIIAADGYGNRWEDAEVYDFILNECLAWDINGNLKDGFTSISDDLAIAIKRHAALYGIKIRN